MKKLVVLSIVLFSITVFSQEKELTSIENIDKGIVIFNKNGCKRCIYTTNYLTENNIDYKLINTSIKKNNLLMWQMLRQNNVLAQSVRMPIVFIDGKLVNSQGDIGEFLKTLN